MDNTRGTMHRVLMLGVTLMVGLVAACDDATQPAAPAALALDDTTITFGALRATHTLVAHVLDASGRPVTGAHIAWRSDAPAVVMVDSAGVATALADGTAHVTASVAALQARATARVIQVPTALQIVGGDRQTAPEGATALSPLVVRVRDRLGAAVPGATVRFVADAGSGAASPAATTSTFDGSASARWTLGATGAQRLTVSAGDSATATGTFTATATAVGPITITRITPDTLVEGDTAIVSGSGFSATAGFDAVRVDGQNAMVIAATDTGLRVVVPSGDCLPARIGSVTARVGSVASDPMTSPVRPSAYDALAVGQQRIIQQPADFCLQFAANDSGGDGYLIGVGAAAEAPTVLNGFTMIGTTGLGPPPTSLAARIAAVPGAPSAHPAPGPSALPREVTDGWRRQYAAEARVRGFDRAILPTLAREARTGRAAGGPRAAPTSAAALPAVGDTVIIRVPAFDSSNPCGNYSTVHTVVKTVGTSGIWLSDLANPPTPDSLTDAEIRAYSDTFDTQIYPTDVSWFGAPSDIDQNGRIVVVLTVAVNRLLGGSLAGFVFAGDLFPGNLACPESNGGEIFYGNVPDPGNVAGTVPRSKGAVTFQMPSLIAHEFTHDIQFGRRFVLSRTAATNVNQSSWELEGQATFAQKAVGDALLGNTAGDDYGATVALTGQGARWYSQGFALLADYFGFDGLSHPKVANAPERCSLFASTSIPTECNLFAYYGASYAFQEYVTDRFGPAYPGGPKALQHDVITAHGDLFGKENWATTVGFDFDSVFSQWAAMLYVDDRVPGIGSALQMTSWNLADIFGPSGFGALGCDTLCQLLPLTESWADFTQARSVRDGSTAYTLLASSGSHPSLAVRVRDPAGAVLRGAMEPQLWVVRIR